MVLTKSAICKSVAGSSRFFLLSCALMAVSFSGAPAQAQEAGVWDKVMGTVGLGAKPAQVATTPAQSAVAPAQPAAVSASQPPVAQPAPVAAAPAKPGMFDNVMKSVGLGGGNPADSIDYSERQKLAVPQQRVLPPPQDVGGPRQVAKRPENEALTKPPTEYTEKVRGPDGQVSGLKESDIAKEKKFLNFF